MNSAFEELEGEIARYARQGAHPFEGDLRARAAALFAAACAAASPRHAFCCDDARGAYLLCATLGAGFDAWQRRVSVSSGTDALLAQAIGAALLERRLDEAEAEIRAELAPDEELAPRVSPGYGDLPLELSHDVLARLDAPRRLGVMITDAHLLVPAKSVTAFVPIRRISGE